MLGGGRPGTEVAIRTPSAPRKAAKHCSKAISSLVRFFAVFPGAAPGAAAAAPSTGSASAAAASTSIFATQHRLVAIRSLVPNDRRAWGCLPRGPRDRRARVPSDARARLRDLPSEATKHVSIHATRTHVCASGERLCGRRERVRRPVQARSRDANPCVCERRAALRSTGACASPRAVCVSHPHPLCTSGIFVGSVLWARSSVCVC
jgi:hypothetical protein